MDTEISPRTFQSSDAVNNEACQTSNKDQHRLRNTLCTKKSDQHKREDKKRGNIDQSSLTEDDARPSDCADRGGGHAVDKILSPSVLRNPVEVRSGNDCEEITWQ